MEIVSMTGNDTVKINNRVMTDLADGDCVTVTFPNELCAIKSGKNGNTIIVKNEAGRQAEVSMRLIRGSSDDKFLNSLMTAQIQSFNSFVSITGDFTKRIGDGAGNVTNDNVILSAGSFVKQVEASSNVDADINQSVSVYQIRFGKGERIIE